MNEKKLDKLEQAALEKRGNRLFGCLDERDVIAYWIALTWPAFPSEAARAAAIAAEKKVFETAPPADRERFWDADERAALEAGRSPFADLPVDETLADPLGGSKSEADTIDLTELLEGYSDG